MALISGSKDNKSAIMKAALERAARIAKIIGGNARENLAQAMKEVWAIAKA